MHILHNGADVFISYGYTLPSGEITRISLGFALLIQDEFSGYVFPRNGMATQELVCELLPIDSGYRVEVRAIISSSRAKPQILRKDSYKALINSENIKIGVIFYYLSPVHFIIK